MKIIESSEIAELKLRSRYITWWVVVILVAPVLLDFFFFNTQAARYARILILGAVLVSLIFNNHIFLKSKNVGFGSILLIGAVFAIGTYSDLIRGGVLTPNIGLLLLFLFIISTNIDLYEGFFRAISFSIHCLTSVSAVAIILRLNPRGYYASSEGYPVFFDFIGIEGRNNGVFPHPNSLGQVAALSLILVIASRSNKLLVLFPILCLIKCGSRTALIGILMALLVYLIVWVFRNGATKGKSVKLESPFAIGGFVLTILLASSVQFLGYLNLLDPSALTSRASIWQSAYSIYKSSPILGLGWGWEQRAVDSQLINIWATSAHNAILDIIFSSGVIGLIVFLVLVSKVFAYFPLLDYPEKMIVVFSFSAGISEAIIEMQYPTIQTYLVLFVILTSNRKV